MILLKKIVKVFNKLNFFAPIFMFGKAKGTAGLEQAYAVGATELVTLQKQTLKVLAMTDQLVENTWTELSLMILLLMLPTCQKFFY